MLTMLYEWAEILMILKLKHVLCKQAHLLLFTVYLSHVATTVLFIVSK